MSLKFRNKILDKSYEEVKDIIEDKLAYCFINPLTAIFAELEGRSYGGGVMELVPSEIRKLIIQDLMEKSCIQPIKEYSSVK